MLGPSLRMKKNESTPPPSPLGLYLVTGIFSNVGRKKKKKLNDYHKFKCIHNLYWSTVSPLLIYIQLYKKLNISNIDFKRN